MQNVRLSARAGAGGNRKLANPKGKRKDLQDGTIDAIHEVTITWEDIEQQYIAQSGRCHWLGIKMSLPDLYVNHSPFAPSVERLDHTRGYHKDNIVLTSRLANRGRNAYKGDDFGTRIKELLQERWH